jgi:hypothetical protein
MRRSIIGLAVTLVMVTASPLSAYSVLSHEATIDVTWDNAIAPLLKQRFPRSTAEDLLRARSFAYGGSVIQDLGYYPFGNKFFSNLVHYVRSGDFVEALVRESRDVDELAFALGALAHYANDISGHPEAVNITVPIVYPKLQHKYGDAVTYAQAPHQHVIVEFFIRHRARRGRRVSAGHLQAIHRLPRRHAAARARLPGDLRSRDA